MTELSHEEAPDQSDEIVDRYWFEIGAQPALDADGFYIKQGEHFQAQQGEECSTADLAGSKCLVLLGPMGSGKSHEVWQGPSLAATGTEEVRFDLGAIGSSEAAIREEIFQSDEITAWMAGSGGLTLILDGFGDAKTRIPNLPRFLLNELGKLDADRLWLRIVSRDSLWPAALTRAIGEALSQEAKEFRLLPLMRSDIERFATRFGVDGSALYSAIDAAGAMGLANQPLTLAMLIEQFRSEGALPDDRIGLYGAAVRHLAVDRDPLRAESMPGESMPLDSRISLARRIAAFYLLGGRSSITTEDVAPESVSTSLTSGDFDLSGCRELLGSSGLFLTTSPGTYRCYHSSVQAYLCAEWMDDQLSVTQVRSLLIAPGGRVWEQFRSVARWLVSLNPEAYRDLVVSDPASFAIELDMPDDGLRELVVLGLLEDPTTYEWFGGGLANLRFSGIEEILRERLAPSEPRDVQLMALRIAASNVVESVLEQVTVIALDQDLCVDVREMAAFAVTQIERESERLLPILAEDLAETGGWSKRTLVAYALDSSWPHSISAKDTFDHLEQIGHQPFGEYASFLSRLAAGLDAEHTRVGLEWLKRNADEIDDHSAEADLANHLIAAGISSDEEQIRLLTAEVICQRAGDYRPLWYRQFEPRQITVSATSNQIEQLIQIVLDIAPPDLSPAYLCSSTGLNWGLVGEEQFGWLLAEHAAGSPHQSTLIAMANMVYNAQRADHCGLVDGLAPDHPLLAQPRVSSEQAALSDWELQIVENNRQREAEAAKLKASRKDDFMGAIDDFNNSEEPREFVRAFQFATRNRNGVRPHRVDLPKLPVWGDLDETDIAAVVTASTTFLSVGRSDLETWIEEARQPSQSQAAMAALLVLLVSSPETLTGLPEEQWQEWAPVIAVHRWVSFDGMSRSQKLALIDLATTQGFHQVMVEAIKRRHAVLSAKETGRFPTEEAIMRLFNSNLETWLLSLATDATDDDLLAGSLRILLKCGSELGHELAMEIAVGADQGRADVALIALLSTNIFEVWAEVKEQVEPARIKSAILAQGVLDRSESVAFESQHAETFADIYVTIEKLLGDNTTSSEAFDGIAKIMGPKDHVEFFKRRILGSLLEDGSESAIRGIEMIADSLPPDEAKWIRAKARQSAQRQLWRPSSVEQLVDLESDQNSVFIASEESLQEWLGELFVLIQEELVGANPLSHLLWNTTSSGAHRPKSEDEASDFLRFRIHELSTNRAVVVNREVQVRRNAPSGIPERADLQLDAVSSDADTISYPIEVKGAWSDELLTAMQDQLVDRYMADLGSRCGTYVVLWPDTEKWDESDSRRGTVTGLDRDAICTQLQTQAEEFAQLGLKIQVVAIDVSYLRPS